MKELDFDINGITDCAIEALATALAINKSLVKLSVSHNHISGEAAIALLQVLRSNDTLQKLGITAGYHQAVWDKLISIVQEINTKRRSQGIQEKLILGYRVRSSVCLML